MTIECPTCNCLFTCTPSAFKRGKGKFCSVDCRYPDSNLKSSKIKGECNQCGRIIKKFPSLMKYKHVFCSRKCKEAFNKIFKLKDSRITRKCKICDKEFKRFPCRMKGKKGKYCSKKCADIGLDQKFKTRCGTCEKEIIIQIARLRNSLSGKNFCSNECFSKYNLVQNKFPSRSRIEFWLEKNLNIKYPNLEIHYCRRDAINSELDIYFPTLKLGIELNGIFHYEPIFGEKDLNRVQNNDKRKFQACLERDIELCIIDTSKITYLKEEKCAEFFNIICSIINGKLEIINDCPPTILYKDVELYKNI